MKKTTIFTLALVLLGVLPAMGQLGNVLGNSNDQPNLNNDFDAYGRDLLDYLYNINNIYATLQPLQDSYTKTAIDNSTFQGRSGRPNPIEAGEEVRRDVVAQSISGTFENNPAVQATLARNEVHREITRGAVEGVLGQQGQERLQEKLDRTDDAINTIDGYEQTAKDDEEQCQNIIEQSLEKLAQLGSSTTGGNGASALQPNSTCYVFRQLIVQSQQAKMLGESLGQTIQMNQSLQYSNLNLANISQQMEEVNRARRVDTSAEAARLLRATSQIDLLGRENQNQESGVRGQESGVRS